MLKDNHIDFCGGLDQALAKTKTYVDRLTKSVPVIVETRNLGEVDICLQHPWISRILLDNMSPQDLALAVAHINGAIQIEASGNIDLENAAAYAETGVDFVSVGAITHSASIVDLSLVAIN
jgi:nicotinate-nucleotide pyrophosphorylase (carboxylating)